MAIDKRIVTPEDIGETIKMGALQPLKYDVDLNALDIPPETDRLELDGTELTLITRHGPRTVDLAPMLPQVVLDTVLKDVQKSGDYLVFTVGNKGDNKADTELRVDVASLLPVVADERTITGNGTTASELAVKVVDSSDNLLTVTLEGLTVSRRAVQELLPEQEAERRDIRLVNASGTTVVGYIYGNEQSI